MNSPYNYSQNELNIIRQNFNNDYTEWDKVIFKDIKESIKKHCAKEQKGRCVYCNTRLKTGTSYIHIEHIVPKSKHSSFTFEPLNLALACEVCNNKKSHTETLSYKNVKNYPRSSRGFQIINPYYDNYTDHIEILDDLFIVGITGKGKRTVEICKLDRLELVVEKALDVYKEKANIYTKLILSLNTTRNPLIAITINKKINELINNFDDYFYEDDVINT